MTTTTLPSRHVHGDTPLVVGTGHGVGRPLAGARQALVLVHGRGGSAADMLGLARELPSEDYAVVAPQAAGHTWYPLSFLAPTERNEPGLSSGLARLREVVDELEAAGVPSRRIVLLGFSQGACLTLEFAARNARRWGGVIAFSGGLIGPPAVVREDRADLVAAFRGTPIFLGCSDRDAHVPLDRVEESSRVLDALGAEVETRIYPGMPHTIIEDEMAWARDRMAALVAESS